MQAYLNSVSAKADMAKHVAKDQVAQHAQDNSPIQTRRDIKGFWAQHPKTCDLYGKIIITWRKSNARRPAHAGCWAAYPYPWWSDLTKLPDRTLKRHLNLLEEMGLIERERGKYGGNRVLSFIRPTVLGLSLSSPRPDDWDHLGQLQDTSEPTPSTPVPAKPQPTEAKIDEKPATLAELQAILTGDAA